MKFIKKVSPNYRDKDHSTKGVMAELSVGLMVIFLFSMVYYYQEYGMDYVLQGVGILLTSIIVAMVTEVLFALVTKRDIKVHIPISTTFFSIGVASFFAIFFGKLVFGGFGHNIFNPAGVGRMVIFTSLVGSTVNDVTTGATPVSAMANAGWLIKDANITEKFLDQFGGLSNLLLGWYPGALGETSALLIILVGIYLATVRS